MRARAADLDIDLTTIDGTGPDGRVVHADLDRELVGRSGGAGATRTAPPRTAASETGNAVSIRGVRRQISNRLSAAWNEIPHITYVDDVDMTEIERLRSTMNDAPASTACA